MRKQDYILSIFCLALGITSCFEDKDSVASITIESVTAIDGLPASESTLYLGDLLNISPEITLSEGTDLSDYTYRWMLARDTIGRERELNWLISLPGGYTYNELITGVFIIRNHRTELEFRKTFSVKIQNNLTPTWLAVYKTPENTLDWVSIQGAPEAFTRFYPGMNELVNGKESPITGEFRGAMVATSELMLFTDKAPGYGQCISLVSGDANMQQDIGEKAGDIRGRVYYGTQDNLDFHSLRYCEGGTRFLIMNNNFYAFNGQNKRLPMYDDHTFLRGTNILQAIASRQFLRLKKGVLIRHKDKSIGCIHEFNTEEKMLYNDAGELFKLDTIYDMFAESTGTGMRTSYKMYIIGQEGEATNIYEYQLTYNTGMANYNAPVWRKTIPIPQTTARNAIAWYGAFAQKYGFYATKQAIYTFDYLNMTSFEPVVFKTFPSNYEIIGIYPLVSGSGTSDKDYGTMVYLYDSSKQTTSLQFFDTVSGAIRGEYPDVIPGRGLEFLKR